MKLPRFRVRTLMIAVAVVAMVLGGDRLWRRRALYRTIAADHAGSEVGSRDSGQVCRENVVGLRERGRRALAAGDAGLARACFVNAEAFVPEAASQDRLSSHYARLRRKYDQAARRPWLSVAPDAPPPE